MRYDVYGKYLCENYTKGIHNVRHYFVLTLFYCNLGIPLVSVSTL